MVPSIRRSLLACVVALIGLGLWQAYRATADSPLKDRTMTVNDEGQELKCRIVKITVNPNGTRSYELQVIATGETMTVEEMMMPPGSGGKDRKLLPRVFQRKDSVESTYAPQPANVKAEPAPAKIVQAGHVAQPSAAQDRAAPIGKHLPLRPRQQQQVVEEQIVGLDGTVDSEKKKRLPERVKDRVSSLLPDRKKAANPDEITEIPTIRPEHAIPAPQPQPTEQPAKSPTFADRFSKLFPSGRPTNKEQPGTLASPVDVPVPAPAQGQDTPPLVQDLPEPEPTATKRPLLPRRLSKNTDKPVPVIPTTSAAPVLPTPTPAPVVISPKPATVAPKATYAPTPARPIVPKVSQARPQPTSPLGQKMVDRFPALSSNAKETHPVGLANQPVINTTLLPPSPVQLPPALGNSKLELASAPPLPPPLPGEPKPQNAARPKDSVIFGSPLATMAANSAQPVKAPSTQAAVRQPSGDNIPAGAGSVLAAKSGARTPVTFVPVPIVTVPDPLRRPGPPEPKIPDAPQANVYVNAFMPTPPNPAMQQQHAQQMMAMARANGAYMNPHLIHPGMVPAHPTYTQMPAQPIQGVSAVNPYAAQRPVAQVNYPVRYQGPTPPNPAMQPRTMAPAYHGHPVPMYPVAPTPAANPAPPQVDQLISMLRDSPYPSQREWAAQTLAACDLQANPQIVTALAESARKDPAGSVRAGCVCCLIRMTVPANEVMGTLVALQNDNDVRVRDQVAQAMTHMGHTPAADRSAIQPVSQKQE